MPESEPEAAVAVAAAWSSDGVHSESLLAPSDSTAAMFWAGMVGLASAVALAAVAVALEAETSGIELLLAAVAAALAAAVELTDPDDGAKNVLQIC